VVQLPALSDKVGESKGRTEWIMGRGVGWTVRDVMELRGAIDSGQEVVLKLHCVSLSVEGKVWVSIATCSRRKHLAHM
jgi:hypothetical protein